MCAIGWIHFELLGRVLVARDRNRKLVELVQRVVELLLDRLCVVRVVR